MNFILLHLENINENKFFLLFNPYNPKSELDKNIKPKLDQFTKKTIENLKININNPYSNFSKNQLKIQRTVTHIGYSTNDDNNIIPSIG